MFGVQDQTLAVIKAALNAVCAAAGHDMAETDPELGSNMMVLFFRDWDELAQVPNLDQLVPDLKGLIARLKPAKANQYRFFRFDEQGAIRACFVFLCMDSALSKLSADALSLGQIVQSMLLWSDGAFRTTSPLAVLGDGTTVVRPEISALLRAAYDPVMPAVADDASHALRLAARMGVPHAT